MVMALRGSPSFAGEDPGSLQAAFLRGEYETVLTGTARQLGAGAERTDEMLYLHGVSALKLRDWETARASLGRLVREYPESSLAPHAWLAIGDSWAGSGDPEKAAEAYARLASGDRDTPLLPQAVFRLGKAQSDLGQWSQAQRSFERVLKEAPGSAEAAWAREILDRGDFFFTVQVGAFVSRANAVKLESELRRRGYEPELSQTSTQGKVFHRVRVGRFERREEAQAQAEQLRKEGFPAKLFP